MIAVDLFIFDSRLLAWLVLAFGAAMMVGNLAALIRPPSGLESEEAPAESSVPPRPPLGRTLTLVMVGALAAIWAVASLLRG
jgi:hypothetical protein